MIHLLNKIRLLPDTDHQATQMIISQQTFNRQQRRAILHELDRIMPDLLGIESQLIAALFGVNPNDYRTLYKAADHYWRAKAEQINKISLKYSKVNEEYITEVFKPLEHES